jgi:hypothetical protein
MKYGDWHVSTGVSWFWGVLTALAMMALAVLAVLALIATIGGNVFALLVLAIAAPLAYLAGRACSRVSSAAVTIDAEEVVVIGPLRTFHVLIHHAERFAAEVRPGFGNGLPTIVLRYDGHRSVGLWLFNRYGSPARFERLIGELAPRTAELNDALDRAKQASARVSEPTPSQA